MHDYDRRPLVASSEEVIDTHGYWPVEVDKPIQRALAQRTARLADYKASQANDHVIFVNGTTTDGRTFDGDVTFFIEGRDIMTTTKIIIRGTVDMGPVPDVLLKMEGLVSNALNILRALGFEEYSFQTFTKYFERHMRSEITNWREGKVIDTKLLRSVLRDAAKRFEDMSSKMDTALRVTIPPGETQPLHKLLDAARKSIGAAARGIPDIG